jgi:glycosyltransferase involved in cell wall biosynthesis
MTLTSGAATPKVSVIVPNYNHARFLERRLSSVLNQTYQDYEVLYLDDASTDNSAQVFERFAGDPRIRVFLNTANSGSPFKQWNKGVREARGEYCWIAEADDYADQTLLETLVEKLEQNPSVGLAYCQSWAVDENDVITGTMASWTDDLDEGRWRADFINHGPDECSRFLIQKCTIPNASAVLIRRRFYEEAGYADQDMTVAGDWMTWARMLLISDVAFVAQPLNYFRHHSNSVRSTKKRSVGTLERYQISSAILERAAVAPEVRERVIDTLCEAWLTDVLSFSRRLPVRRVWSLYLAARRIEPKVNRRLAGKIVQLAARKIKARLGTRAARRRVAEPLPANRSDGSPSSM